jgi:alkanesulfonate monooxygenase SsuD/methylene tetrahydromethanopterin reductase-like flavin-dependent oxidoreductase (luciferase family)
MEREQSITFDGTYDRVTGAGLAPLPVQRPIPIWFGAQSPAAYRRAGRLADGWFPQMSPGPKLDEAKAMVEEAAVQAGRDPSVLGMEGRASWTGSAEELDDLARRWRESGATHLAVNTMKAGLRSADEHLAALATAAETLELRKG